MEIFTYSFDPFIGEEDAKVLPKQFLPYVQKAVQCRLRCLIKDVQQLEGHENYFDAEDFVKRISSLEVTISSF